MKRLMISVALSVCTMLSWAQFSGSGSGTENDPYLIFNPIQLNQIRNFLGQNVHFKLMSDIDLTNFLEDENPSQGWQPIGTEASGFAGTLEGNGKTISGLWIDRSNSDNIGFFGYCIKGAKIKNITLTNVSIKGRNNAGSLCGSVTSSSNITIQNCIISGKVIGGTNVGGAVGYIKSGTGSILLDNISSSVSVNGKDYTGGIAGYCGQNNNYIKTTNCYVNADIIGESQTGGIIGYLMDATMSGCSFDGKVSGTSFVGGICGRTNIVSYIISISNCYATGSINNTGEFTGGLIGTGGCKVSDSYFSGIITGQKRTGGLVGSLPINGTIKQCYFEGSVCGSSYVGGLCGDNYSSGTVESNVVIASSIKATEGYVNRLCYKTSRFGTMGTSKENKSYNRTIIINQGVVQDVSDTAQDGTGVSINTLRLKATYEGMGWDFNDIWEIQETESFPYMKRQTAPPVITSQVVSGNTSISGKCIESGLITLEIDGEHQQLLSSGNNFLFTVSPLQANHEVRIRVKADGKEPSYYTTKTVSYLGNGTEEDPYLVYTASDLTGVHRQGYFKLMNDINLTSYIDKFSPDEGWESIGRAGSETIHFDGNGYKITGLWCNSTRNNTGLFSCFANGTIKNLTVETKQGKQVKGGNNTGILIGKMINGTIENCIVNGNVTDGTPVGGLVGLMDGGSISKCRSAVSIYTTQGTTYVGGLVGEMTAGTIAECVTIGTLNATGTESYAGGLVGKNSAAVSNCYSTMTINSSYNAAGLIAYNYGSVEKCYATGNLKSNNYAAGIIGYNDGANAIIKNCVALNAYIEVIYESQQSQSGGYGQRIVGGLKNNPPAPEMNNYALNTTQLSVNNVPQRIYDDLLNGVAKTKDELMQQSTYTSLGWNFDEVWGMTDSADYPLLKWVIELNGQEEPDFIPGDANGDDKVNGTDIVVIANMVLGRKEKNAAADANQDGKVNGTDIVVVANIVLGRSSAPVRKAPAVTASGSATLSIEPFDITAGSEATMTIDLNNPDDELTLVQFDLTLPKGLSIKTVGGDFDIDMAGRTTWRKHSLDANLNDGYYTFLLKSDSNTPIDGTNGGIITVTLVADATFDGGKIVIDNTVLTTPNEVEINPARYEYSLGGDEPTPVPDGTCLFIEPFSITAGSEATMTVDLNNADDVITLVQFDLTLPKGLSIKTVGGDFDIDMAGRTSWRKHSLDANLNDGYYTFLLKSDSNTPIDGTEGGIITVTLVADASFAGGKIVIDNTVLTTPEEVEINPARYEYSLGGNEPTPVPEGTCLFIEPFSITAGSEATMTIDLNNADDVITLVQFDLTLPKGLSIKTVGGDYDIDMAGRTTWRKHSLDANLNDGYYTFLLKSDSNTPIDGTSGGIITVTLVADASFVGGKIVIDNTVLTTPEEVEINPSRYEYEITEPTSLSVLNSDSRQLRHIYNLQGQRLLVPQKGINIIDGKKVLMK